MKQLNPRFFPGSLQEQAAWYSNFSIQFALVAAVLGLADEMRSVTADAAVIQKLANVAVQLKAYRNAVLQFRTTILTGSLGAPVPEFPALPSYGTPEVVSVGMFERLDILIKKIRLSAAYTEEIGALLGIIPANRPVPPPADLQPDIKIAALPGSSVQVSFKRYNTNGVVIQTKLDKAEDWTDSGRYYTSPINLDIPQNPTGLPRAVAVRARYIDGNTAVGQFSPVVSTSTQPEN